MNSSTFLDDDYFEVVADGNWDAAQAVLGAKPGNRMDWVCSACQAENDAGFDVCWQCGRECSEPGVTALPQSASSSDEVSPVINADRDNLQRAWKAAIVGAMVPIGLTNVYSMAMLLRVDLNVIPDGERWKFVAAWLMNVVVLLILLALLKGF